MIQKCVSSVSISGQIKKMCVFITLNNEDLRKTDITCIRYGKCKDKA